MDEKNIEFVKSGYSKAAIPYRQNKDPTQSQIPLFLQWLEHPDNSGSILELGCATGYPIAEKILSIGREYMGIDLSPEHIQMAIEAYPSWKNNFKEAEMLEFCRKADSDSLTGIVSMFSIRHLPRIHHVELFNEILRILKSRGLLLVDFPRYQYDGRDTWFDNLPMYWSSFSEEWSRITLKELGFELLDTFEDTKIFNGEEEKTLFLLYQKPE
ncbi:MAG: class I SAM-dependent methyltransferase [Candidatus Hodarchaeales archaeon]|jgi:SAM-dependent methyltransferase